MMIFDWQRKLLINATSLLIGVYSSCYFMSLLFISVPIDHWCAPPFNLNEEHWSPYNWRKNAIPWWDQIPNHTDTRIKINHQSRCHQFNVVQNVSNGIKNIEIEYSVENIVTCQFGWYFIYYKMSIVSEVWLL